MRRMERRKLIRDQDNLIFLNTGCTVPFSFGIWYIKLNCYEEIHRYASGGESWNGEDCAGVAPAADEAEWGLPDEVGTGEPALDFYIEAEIISPVDQVVNNPGKANMC